MKKKYQRFSATLSRKRDSNHMPFFIKIPLRYIADKNNFEGSLFYDVDGMHDELDNALDRLPKALQIDHNL